MEQATFELLQVTHLTFIITPWKIASADSEVTLIFLMITQKKFGISVSAELRFLKSKLLTLSSVFPTSAHYYIILITYQLSNFNFSLAVEVLLSNA